jgi:putative inorganic carbon (hco3(-)) transporter
VPIHFGLEQYLATVLYLCGIMALLLSIFWRPIIGLGYLIPLIPLQTTRYRMLDFPLGGSVVGIMLLGVAIGLLRQRRWIFPSTPLTIALAPYVLYTFATIFLDPDNLQARFKEWQDYMMMPLLFCLVVTCVRNIEEMKLLLVLMCFSVFVMDKSFWGTVSGRDYSSFSRDLQEGGAMGYAGVQGMAAFNAQFAWFLVALTRSEHGLRKWVGLGLAGFAAVCVMYSFSRGGYVAFIAGWLLLGLLRNRWLLLLLLVFALTWTSLVPNAVQERVLSTYDENSQLDRSSEIRLELWSDALDLFRDQPLVGTGFNTYAYMRRVGHYEDTHNIYLKVLVETGIIGLLLFLFLISRTFQLGYRLFRRATDAFLSALGLGLATWVLCSATASLFGDRWTYLQINGYLWVLAGFVARGLALLESPALESAASQDESRHPLGDIVHVYGV